MTSSLAWLQFDESQARRSRELIRALEEPTTLDSIAIGTIRDGFADILAPGTSTLHTRVRYFRLVPWAMKQVAARRPRTRDQYDRWLREVAVRTIDMLKAGSPGALGIVGVDRGSRVQTLPSTIYWNALAAWGIRADSALSRSELRDLVTSGRGARRSEDGQLYGYVVWDDLPPPPEGFPDVPLSILPNPEEADYLLARMAGTRLSRPSNGTPEPTVLATVARRPQTALAPQVWDLPGDVLPGSLAEIVELAWGFSLVIQGARLRYLDLLFRHKAARGGVELDRTDLDVLIEDWLAEMDRDAGRVSAWAGRLLDMYDLLTEHGVRIGTPLRSFVTGWCTAAAADPEAAFASRGLAEAIIQREASLKKGSARLSQDSPLAHWSGQPVGSDRLSFRWPVASGHIRDCVVAKEVTGARA